MQSSIISGMGQVSVSHALCAPAGLSGLYPQGCQGSSRAVRGVLVAHTGWQQGGNTHTPWPAPRSVPRGSAVPAGPGPTPSTSYQQH
jgi:hypothetical protein